MDKKRVMRLRPLLLFLQGVVIGTGAILPGISGGVLCMAFGLYEPMVALFAHPLRSLQRNRRLLIPLLLGCGAGFLLLAGVVEYLLRVSAVGTTALFAGLICGTIPGLMEKTEGKGSRKGWTGFVLTLVGSFLLLSLLDDGLGGRGVTANTGWYVFCGAVWALSMILPGLSSSSVLLFMGLTAYDTQKIKQMLIEYGDEVNDSTQKLALIGSLSLYLDFINLFLYILRLFGNNKE